MGRVLSEKDGARLCSNHQGLHFPQNIRDLGKNAKMFRRVPIFHARGRARADTRFRCTLCAKRADEINNLPAVFAVVHAIVSRELSLLL